MPTGGRVELQAEVEARREHVFPLFASAEGMRRWLDDASFEPRVDAEFRARLHEAVAVGRVVALDPPQHISFSWDWEGEPIGVPSVVAFDAIDHGARTHVTLRQVGFRDARQLQAHDALWRYWFERFKEAARAEPYP